MTGISYDALTGDWAITVDTAQGEQHEGYAATAQEAAARLEEAVAKWARHEALHNWQAARAHGAHRVLDAGSGCSRSSQRAPEVSRASIRAMMRRVSARAIRICG